MKKVLSKTKATSLALSALLATTSLVSAETGVNDRITEIQSKYRPQFEALESEGRRIGEDSPRPTELEAGVGVDFDVTWDRTSIKFDVPEIVMKRRDIKLHLPQSRMKTTSIKWDNPETFMAVTKVGEYPCFKGWKWYTCDIKTKVPQVRMVRREAKFDVPQFSWDMTTIKIDIPEFYSKRVEIKFDLPQFKAKNIKVEVSKQKAAAEGLEQKAQTLAEAQKREINAVVTADLARKRVDVEREFDLAIVSLSDAIGKLKAAGANPEAVPSDDGTQNLVAMLIDLQKKRGEALTELDAKVAELNTAT